MPSDNAPTTIRQIPDKAPITSPDKEVDKSEADGTFEKILTTCEINYGISKHGKKNPRVPLLASNKSYKDTNDWSSECDELF